MITIHKYLLDDQPLQLVEMPRGAIILHASAKGDKVYLWAEVDDHPTKTKVQREIVICGTGQPLRSSAESPRDYVYIGTVHAGPFVWHIYEKTYSNLKGEAVHGS